MHNIAWAAGLFEGEGTFGVYGNGRKARNVVSLSIVMTDEDVIRNFAAVVENADAGMFGTIDGPLPSQRKGGKPLWRWRARGNSRAKLELVRQFLPYFGLRRSEQFRKFEQYIDAMPTSMYRRRLTAIEKDDAVRRLRAGELGCHIAELYHVSPAYVSKLRRQSSD